MNYKIRNNQPIVELYNHLLPLVDVELVEPPKAEKAINKAVNNLPGAVFRLS